MKAAPREPASGGQGARRGWREAVRPVATVAVVVLGAAYVWIHRGDFALLGDFDFRWAVPILAAPAAGYAVNGRILRLLVERFGVALRPVEWFGLTVLHAFGNYAPVPQAGTIARGVYLKRVHALPYPLFLSVVAATYVGFLVVLGIVAAVAAAILAATGRGVPWPLWVLVGVAIPLAATFVRGFWTLPGVRRLEGRIGFGEALLHGPVLARVGAWQTALIGVHAAGLWIAFASLDVAVTPWAAVFVSLFAMGSGVLNVTPGNVGVAEGAAWFAGRYVGLDPTTAVVGYALYRLATAVTTFALAPFYLSRLSESTLERTPVGDEGGRTP